LKGRGFKPRRHARKHNNNRFWVAQRFSAAISTASSSTVVIPNRSQPVNPARVSEESAFARLKKAASAVDKGAAFSCDI
jgi:hypothetical protein